MFSIGIDLGGTKIEGIVLDPDVVVLGGGVSNFAALYTEGVLEVARCVFSDSLETPIGKNQLDNSAGVIGAVLIGT